MVDLVATSIAAGAPALGSPTLVHVHALTATGITAGMPVLGSASAAVAARVFPIAPNRRSEATVIRRSFSTEILVSRSGREQRRALRQQPRKDVEFTVTLSGACRRTFDRFLVAGQRQVSLIAEVPRFVTLAAGLAAGASSVDLGAPPPAWLAADARALLVSGTRIESRTVAGVAGTVVSFTGAGGASWPAGTRLQPGLTCRLQAALAASRQSPRGIMEVTVKADVEPGTEPAEDLGAAAATFDGREVFLVKPDRWAAFNIGLDQPGRERVDYGAGIFLDFHPVAFAQRLWQAQYTACDAAKAEALRAFTARMKGQRGEFFMPSFLSDLVIAAQANGGTNTLRVDGFEVARDFSGDPVHQAIAVRHADGSWQFRKIASMAIDGAETVITLATTWSVPVPLSAQVSWLKLRRLASDIFEEQWPRSGRGASVALPILTLEYLAAEAA